MRNLLIATIVFIFIFIAFATWHKSRPDVKETGEAMIQKSQGQIYQGHKGDTTKNQSINEGIGSEVAITIMADAQKCDAGQCRIGKRRK